ncbi:hypothetical protein W02_15680 [Nitrospira sp. KM1]|uniref:hypothetical protein n=1 Tax=Nitrospira sp. KM1 TaxID=1936990 RepID=UPI0013A7A306|nr:hypothetical protein [Nitrospira sp. KM1]BCA54428.1 hypothetical protein W02_15680 [Nitrospira sp. KM1]
MARAPVQKSVFDEPPRKQVLLLSCMDVRLLDNTVGFMNRLNLQNRYDQAIFAGAAMGARLLTSTPDTKEPALPWKTVFFDHLAAAINLLHRDIKDIFLLEHLDCGAYKYLHPDSKVREEYSKARDVSKLEKFHRAEARHFAREVKDFCENQRKNASRASGDAWKDIRVRCLLMDLTGCVTDL